MYFVRTVVVRTERDAAAPPTAPLYLVRMRLVHPSSKSEINPRVDQAVIAQQNLVIKTEKLRQT